MGKVSLATDDNVPALKKFLDHTAARQKVAARNLTNCTTEGYQPKKIEFAEELGKRVCKVELSTRHPKHLRSSQARVNASSFVEVVDEQGVTDSAVRLERTVAELADAELAYSTAAKLVSKRVATLRTAITGGR